MSGRRAAPSPSIARQLAPGKGQRKALDALWTELAALPFALLTLSLGANQAASGLALTIFGVGLSAFIGQSYISYNLPGLKPIAIPLLSKIPVLGPILFVQDAVVYLSLIAFAGVAFTMVSLAENARVPVDNPATHLELTMIHEAMILEYSGRHLALIEWASSLKLFAYCCMGIALFFPFGVAVSAAPFALIIAGLTLTLKLALGGALLALIETVSAKMRVFRAPEFLGTAFLLAVLAMLVHLLLESGR